MVRMIMTMLVALVAATACQAATITITVHGVKTTEGDMRASLCDSEARYKKDDCTHDGVVPAIKGTTTIKFEHVLPGRYAFTILHDKNKNGKMDSNFLNIPKEGFAFSNNIKPTFSEPPFKKVAFTVGDADVAQSVDLVFY